MSERERMKLWVSDNVDPRNAADISLAEAAWQAALADRPEQPVINEANSMIQRNPAPDASMPMVPSDSRTFQVGGITQAVAGKVEKCPRCGFMTSNPFACPICKMGGKEAWLQKLADEQNVARPEPAQSGLTFFGWAVGAKKLHGGREWRLSLSEPGANQETHALGVEIVPLFQRTGPEPAQPTNAEIDWAQQYHGAAPITAAQYVAPQEPAQPVAQAIGHLRRREPSGEYFVQLLSVDPFNPNLHAGAAVYAAPPSHPAPSEAGAERQSKSTAAANKAAEKSLKLADHLRSQNDELVYALHQVMSLANLSGDFPEVKAANKLLRKNGYDV